MKNVRRFAAGFGALPLLLAFGNVCEFFRYETGGHPPGFLIQNREEITEQASGFICRNVLGGCS